MAVGPNDHLIGHETVNADWSSDSSRALLYAVGVGAGLDDPLQELLFTTENSLGMSQAVIPSFVTLMGLRSNWMEQMGWHVEGLSPIGIVQGEQSITLAVPLPVSGTVQISTVLRDVFDKGSGALVVKETRLTLAGTGEHLGITRRACSSKARAASADRAGPLGRRPGVNPSAGMI